MIRKKAPIIKTTENPNSNFTPHFNDTISFSKL
jgi:hypothetical protein